MSGFYSFFLVLFFPLPVPFFKEPDTKVNLASLTCLGELTLLFSLHAVYCQYISKSVSLFASLECSLLFIVRACCWSASLKNFFFHSLLIIGTSIVPRAGGTVFLSFMYCIV